MKIALVCRPRTASTAIIHSLAAEYNLTNLNERYLSISIGLPIHSDAYKAFMKIKNLPTPESQFHNNIKNITTDLLNQNNFILKIFPRMLTVPYFRILQSDTLTEYKNKILFNLSDTMHFEMYDKIYLLDRDFHSSCASWVYSTHTHSFFISADKIDNQPQIKLTAKDYNQLRFFILENVLYHKLLDYLDKKQIAKVDISNNFSDYINQHSPVIKSERKFSKLIDTYDDMCRYIDEYHAYCISETKDWLFY